MTILNDTQRHYWLDRYALRDSKGNVVEDDITDTWKRVADAIGRDEEQRLRFYELLQDFKFVPGGRILAGAGAESEKTFYNCYVIPVETSARRDNRKTTAARPDAGNDSREAIFDTIGTMVGIMSRGGGVGINWSTLRPAESYLTRVSGTSSGPVGWMDVASTAVGEVIQGGSRRGAAMFMLDVWHPDVLKFIDAKRDNKKITNANVSVGITQAFMEALSRDEDWTFIFPDTTHEKYDEVWDGDIEAWREAGLPVAEFGTIPAADVWRAIAEAAHASGEPGVIFLDRYNELSTANGAERIICVNPCGEQGLGAYSVCNLGAMNLYAYIDEDLFDWDNFYDDVATAIEFLDRVVDVTPNFIPEVQERQEQLRRIGLGVMGLADALIAQGTRYGSPESVSFTEGVFSTMKASAIRKSAELAQDLGPAKGWQDYMLAQPYLNDFINYNGFDIFTDGLRNIFLLTQAPTGTTSLLADVNSGIEPYFSLKTWREDRTGGRFVFARAVAEVLGMEEIVEGDALPDYPDYVVTSKEVTVDEHIAIQAAVQKYVDSSVSKTINAPSDQTVEETARAFTRAYYAGLKGIAYYRDGSRDKQVLYHKNPNDRIKELEAEVKRLSQPLDVQLFNGPIILSSPENVDLCPACEQSEIVREEGCMKCHHCGWSAC